MKAAAGLIIAGLAALATVPAISGPQPTTYRWVTAPKPPEGAVKAPDGAQRYLCAVDAQRPGFGPGAIEHFIGAYHDDGCHADDGGTFLVSTGNMQFLTVASGPPGGQWSRCDTHQPYWNSCFLPSGWLHYSSWMSSNLTLCEMNGEPAVSYAARVANSSDWMIEGACDVTVGPGNGTTWFLIGQFG